MTKEEEKERAELENEFLFLEAQVSQISESCRRIRQRLVGVSTPATRINKSRQAEITAQCLAHAAKTRLRRANRLAQ